MCFFITMFLLSTWLVKYPDIIVGQVNIITSRFLTSVVKVNAPILKRFPLVKNETIFMVNTLF